MKVHFSISFLQSHFFRLAGWHQTTKKRTPLVFRDNKKQIKLFEKNTSGRFLEKYHLRKVDKNLVGDTDDL